MVRYLKIQDALAEMIFILYLSERILEDKNIDSTRFASSIRSYSGYETTPQKTTPQNWECT